MLSVPSLGKGMDVRKTVGATVWWLAAGLTPLYFDPVDGLGEFDKINQTIEPLPQKTQVKCISTPPFLLSSFASKF